MRLHDLCHALVIERTSVTIGDYIVAIQAADDRNHVFGQRFTFFPIRKVVIEIR